MVHGSEERNLLPELRFPAIARFDSCRELIEVGALELEGKVFFKGGYAYRKLARV
jgi:hypothetical protein